MNQILEGKKQDLNQSTQNYNKKNNKIKPFKVQLSICLIVLLISLSFYGYHMYDLNKKETISKNLMDRFNITTLYSDTDNYNSLQTSINNNSSDKQNIYVIGLIEISSINLTYPILSEANEEFLKISPCRFYGPMPNEVGNLCIAGHNYKNYKFFSRLNDVSIHDIITIQDLSGNKINYKVYDKYEVNADELDCTNQDTNQAREITLITCNSINNTKRIVVKAKETG